MQLQPVESSGVGFNLVGEVGYRFGRRISAGLGGAIGRQSASYDRRLNGAVYNTVEYTIVPIELGAFVHARPSDRFWGGFLVGAHLDQTRFAEESAWHKGLGLSLELGYDVANIGSHWLAVVARATGSYATGIGYGALAAGVAYRR